MEIKYDVCRDAHGVAERKLEGNNNNPAYLRQYPPQW